MRFLHAADLHIDSPLRGLEAYDGAPVARLRNATREAFERLVTLALEQRVDFVVLAGDLFDGKWPDVKTGLWTAAQFRRLAREAIPVFVLRGNHDAASLVRQAVSWPENVREFPVDRPATFELPSLRVALHGQGFSDRETRTDLAASYPPPVPGWFNVGVLHTSLTGDPQHDTYAPTTEDTLVRRGYDYWALGHIHARQTIRQHPYIAFSGCTQGRHVLEPGPKGCLLVTVADGQVSDVTFHETSVVRWQQIEVALGAADRLPELYAHVQTRLRETHERGRFLAARVIVRGSCAAHRDLLAPEQREEAIAELRNRANELENVWIEHVRLETTPPIDLDELRATGGLLGDLLQMIDEAAVDDERLRALAEGFKPLTDKHFLELSQAGLDPRDPAHLRRWLQQAQGLLVASLGS